MQIAIQMQDVALNSAMILPLEDFRESFIAEISCLGSFDGKEILLYHKVEKFDPKIKNLKPLIYFPKVLLPTYEGKNIKINWFLKIYQKNKIVVNENLKLLSVAPSISKQYNEKPEGYDMKIDNINLVAGEDNEISIKFSPFPSIQKIYLACEESVNPLAFGRKYSQVVYFENLDFKVENGNVSVKFTPDKNYPSIYCSALKVNHYLIVKSSDIEFKIPVYVYQEKIKLYPEPRQDLKNLILKYLNEYGPMKVGELISTVARKEKIKVKSKTLKEDCEELIQQGIITYSGLGLHAGVLYLRDKWLMKQLKN